MDAPLVVDGRVKVDVADYEGALLRVPEQYRGEVRMSADRIATLIDSVFVTRQLAARAREAGLDKDPAVQRRMQQLQEAFLADLYVVKLQKDPVAGNLEQRAKELYLADTSKYTVPEQVHVEQVFIGLEGRTREMALQRANQVYEEAKAGKEEFLALAFRYSDEPQKQGYRGELGWMAPAKLDPAIRKAVAPLAKGGVAKPFETDQGYYVVRLADRKAQRTLTFEEVKDRIIAGEKERIAKERVDDIVKQIRSSPTVELRKATVDALVIPLDPEMVKKATEAQAAK